MSWPVSNYNHSLDPYIPTQRGDLGWQFWQYSYKGDGTKYGLGRAHAADLDVFNGTKEDLIKFLNVEEEGLISQELLSEPKIAGIETSWEQNEKGFEIKNKVLYE